MADRLVRLLLLLIALGVTYLIVLGVISICLVAWNLYINHYVR